MSLVSSNPQPRAWTHDDLEPGPNPDGNFPKVVDKYGVRWCADEREDGFEGWQSDSHGFRVWKTWFNLAFERGPLNEYVDTPQASSAERVQEVIDQYSHQCNTCEQVPAPFVVLEEDVLNILADLGVRSSAERSEEDGGRCAPTPSELREDSAVYVRLSNRPVNYTTEQFNGAVNVDMDDYDEPVGVELLGAVSVEIDGVEVTR